MRIRSRGVSLVEALVALAVMAFGILGIVGLQMSLRQNADISKQRAEAVRIAQETIEQRRAFSAMAAASGVTAYADILARAATTVPGITSNATFTRTETVVDFADPLRKSLVVDVAWQDRAGTTQSVRLSTLIAGVPPAVAAGVGFPGAADPRHRGRHAAIPPAAVDQGTGTSSFDLPGSTPGALVRWIFDNQTGFITRTCTGTAAAPICVTANARLLAGFVAFATTTATPEDAERPPSPSQPVGVQVTQTAPVSSTVTCFTQQEPTYVAYYCAVPVDLITGNRWSGRAEVLTSPLAISVLDASAARLRVCRYTPVRGCHPAVGDAIWGETGATASCSGAAPTPKRKMTNADHPLDYFDLDESLINQNFLVIRAGDGTTPFDCPADDGGTPLINGNTWHHQPAS
jgi:Tfp pilus assembly protein PilV